MSFFNCLCLYKLVFLYRGTDNVIGVESTLRCNDNLVFVLPYFPHQKFQVTIIIILLHFQQNNFLLTNKKHSPCSQFPSKNLCFQHPEENWAELSCLLFFFKISVPFSFNQQSTIPISEMSGS